MVQDTRLPFDRSYWVEPGRLLAGYYPGDRDEAKARRKLRGLLDCGIRCTLNLMEEHELGHDGQPFRPYAGDLQRLAAERGHEVTCLRLPIRDMDVPSRQTMRTILDTIDDYIRRDCPIYVHCWGGLGRTGTVIGCYLVRHGMAQGEEALARLVELRLTDAARHRPSPEAPAQMALVRSWRGGE